MSRSNLSIGIVSSLINVGNGVQPLIIGIILDKCKFINEDGVEDFERGIKKVNLLMCLIDGVAAVCLLIWVIYKPQMLNGRAKQTKMQNDKKEEAICV